MTAMKLHRYGASRFGKIGAGARMVRSSPLPPGARWVEYLESTGTQYIDTGVAINCVTDIVDCRVTVTSVKTYGAAFGVYELIDNAGRFWGVRRNGTQDLWQILWGEMPNQALDLDSFYDIHYEHGTDKCYINETIGTSTVNVEYTKPLYICALNGSKGASNYNVQRLYSFSIRRNNVLVLNLRPIAIGSTGYMLDLVSGEYLPYGNKGTGDFVIGPDIPSPI